MDNIESFLAHFAQHFLHADVYNALKHGLAVRPGDAATQVDKGELLKAEGPAIEYLSLRRDTDGHPRLAPEYYLDLARSLNGPRIPSQSPYGIPLERGRLRYLDEQPDGLNLWTTPAYEEVTQRLDEGVS